MTTNVVKRIAITALVVFLLMAVARAVDSIPVAALLGFLVCYWDHRHDRTKAKQYDQIVARHTEARPGS